MTSNETYLPFSQRMGYEPVPAQLRLGEVSSELRRLLDYGIHLEIRREARSSYDGDYLSSRWERISHDLHVQFFKKKASSFQNKSFIIRKDLEEFFYGASIGKLFDLIEFLIRHPKCETTLYDDFSQAFVSARAAYRIIDRHIVAIGTEQQGAAFVMAIAATEAIGADAARKHLIEAATCLRSGDWSGSVRESIHAVEALALQLSPETTGLGPALTAMERRGHLHGGLRAAFSSLYGYTSDEKGVRHALVFRSQAQVDEADALFMLGACASFVSYMIARMQ